MFYVVFIGCCSRMASLAHTAGIIAVINIWIEYKSDSWLTAGHVTEIQRQMMEEAGEEEVLQAVEERLTELQARVQAGLAERSHLRSHLAAPQLEPGERIRLQQLLLEVDTELEAAVEAREEITRTLELATEVRLL